MLELCQHNRWAYYASNYAGKFDRGLEAMLGNSASLKSGTYEQPKMAKEHKLCSITIQMMLLHIQLTSFAVAYTFTKVYGCKWCIAESETIYQHLSFVNFSPCWIYV